VEVVASLSQGRTAAAQCGLFTHKSVPVIFERPCVYIYIYIYILVHKEAVRQVGYLLELYRDAHGHQNIKNTEKFTLCFNEVVSISTDGAQ